MSETPDRRLYPSHVTRTSTHPSSHHPQPQQRPTPPPSPTSFDAPNDRDTANRFAGWSAAGQRARAVVMCLMAALFISSLIHYGVRDGLAIGVLLGFGTTIASLLGWIPVLGPVAYWFVATRWTLPTILAWCPSAHSSWITTGYLWIGLVLSVVYTLCSITLVVATRR